MQDQSIGLKSITERLTKLETGTSSFSVVPGSTGTMISGATQLKQETQKQKVDAIFSKYKVKINKNLKAEGPNDIATNITKAISFTVKFVEKKAKALAKILELKLSGEFKLQSALDLLQSIVTMVFPKDFLINAIEHFVQIHFPGVKFLCF